MPEDNTPSVTPSSSDSKPTDAESKKEDAEKLKDDKAKKEAKLGPKAGELLRVAPMPPNPYFAYILFAVGNNDFSKLPPEHIQNMTYTRVTESGGNKFEITLYDETAIRVEYLISQAFAAAKEKAENEKIAKKASGENLTKENQKVDETTTNPDGTPMSEEAKRRKKTGNTVEQIMNEVEAKARGIASETIKLAGANPAPSGSGQSTVDVKFQYGYVNGESSPVIALTLTKLDIDFNSVGATLRLEGTSTAAVKAKAQPKSCTYEDKLISDIVKDICKEEGWEEGIIVPTKPVAGEGKENRPFCRKNQPATVFISSELCPKAISADTGDGEYQFTLDDSSKKVNFRPKYHAPSMAASSTMHSYEFAWGSGNRNSRVIDFNPQYEGTVVMLNGGGQIEAATFDAVKNQMFTTGYDKETNKNRTTMAEKAPVDQSTTKTKIGFSSCSPDDMDSIAAMMWLSQAGQFVKATLTILGDALINPYDVVSMVVLNKDGYAHHTSGAYMVTKVTDTISGGSFTTQLEMQRNAMKIGLDESGGISIEMVIDMNTVGGNNSSNSSNQNQQLSGDGNGDIVRVAMGEIGYKESGDNDTKYGQWFGMNNQPWCAMFVSWCANQAGISTDIIPKTAAVEGFYTFFKNKNQWYDGGGRGGSYTPVQGDIILFQRNYSTGDHVGIVAGVEGGKIVTIEGNTSDECAKRTYDPSNNYIFGYGHPAYTTTGQSVQIDTSGAEDGANKGNV